MMNYGMSTKNKSQLTNYKSKQKSKPKNHSNSSSINTIISEKELNRPMVDTFRKTSNQENGVGFTKFKTSKNSPERFIYKSDKTKDLRSLSGKQKESLSSNINMNSINVPQNIKKVIKENVSPDLFFQQKMQMLYNKKQSQQKNDNSQLTYSNIYNQSNRIKLESSLSHKGSKNESFVKKKGVNAFEEEQLLNYNNNGVSPRIKDLKEMEGYKAHMRIPSYNHCESIKEISYNNKNNHDNVTTATNSNNHFNYSNGYNNQVSHSKSNSKTKKIISNSLMINSNYNQHINSMQANKGITYGKIGSCIGGNDIMRQSNKGSSPNIIGEYKRFNQTAYPTKNNSRKNSMEKSSNTPHHNYPNQPAVSSSSSVINVINSNNYQNSSKNSKSQMNTKRSSSSLMKTKKFTEEPKTKYQSIGNYEARKNEANKSNEHYDYGFKSYAINNNHINPSPRIASSRLPMSKKEIDISNIENNDSQINNKNVKSQKEIYHQNKYYYNAEGGANDKSNSNFNDIKYEFVSNHHKADSGSFKSNHAISNKPTKKYDDGENDFFLAKYKVNDKKNKSITTGNSKPNSKSNSRIEDYLYLQTPKMNEELYHALDIRNEKESKKHPIIANKKSSPISMCQSPLGKPSSNEMGKKMNDIKLAEIELESKQKKLNPLAKYNECVKKSVEILENNKCNNNLRLDDIRSIPCDEDIERILNETNESIQSTAREAIFYRKEMEKISNYIRQYYTINKVYPLSKIKFYKIGRVLGRGAFGKVNLALHTCSGRLVAMKSFNKTKHQSDPYKSKIKKEIEMLTQLNHPFVSQILDSFETPTHYIIVMEYICSDLQKYVKKYNKVPESSAKIIFKQIIEGLKFIHHNKIVHRDIKLDNILINLDNTVKICDFGVSIKVVNDHKMFDHCGTPAYIAPEIFQRKGYQEFGCDIWSAGVSLYYIISGTLPFKVSNPTELKTLILSGRYERLDKDYSPEVQDLIEGMLQVDPRKRMTIKNILSHPWLSSVNLQNRSNMNLFTKGEKLLLSKFNIDFLNCNKEDIIENFTMKNLITVNKEIHGNTKSYILAPFNSAAEKDDSLFCSEINFENNNCKFGGKVKQININYELNNNQEFDNGIIISHQSKDKEKNKEEDKKNKKNVNNTSSSSSKGQHGDLDDYAQNSGNNNDRDPRDKDNSNNDGYDNDEPLYKDEEVINERLLREIEMQIGYKQRYLYDCLKNKQVNYATATYKLLNKSLYARNSNNGAI